VHSRRWGPKIKQEILKSRVSTTRRLAAAINNAPSDSRPKVFVSSSAVGYYGTSQSDTFTESSQPGSDFLADVCKEWESAANEADARVVVIRNGIVLSRSGGALAKMEPMFKILVGVTPSQAGTRAHRSPSQEGALRVTATRRAQQMY
jgi:uncharacterized protein